ncbi:hypothetical protein Tco_0843406 [Tanacetum coccineum]|uniref:Uncharacterized protein n=1 Tax=Tanacetum coccineum TaxID=301880 RepID=A0ABQ5B3S1_9ASTR
MHTTMVPEQVKTMKIQAGIQVSRPRELTRQLQLWKRFGRLYLIVFVLVRNIVHALETTCSSLHDQVLGYERLKEQIEEFQDAQMNIINDKVAKLDVDLLEMALHLEEKFYPHLLTTISGQRWLLTRGLKLVVVKCLNSLEYLAALGSAISRAIEKGMQSGLSVKIDHGKAGRSLADVVAYNPAAEADYNATL